VPARVCLLDRRFAASNDSVRMSPAPQQASNALALPDVGDELAGYRLQSVIGRGGMGVVYLAEHAVLGRRAAIKVLAPGLASDDDFRERFARESQLVAAIDHPNIIPVYDAGEVGGLLYQAMRYVPGGDLAGRLAEGSLEPGVAAQVVAQVAGALDAAHAHGIVHRDVKPGNILIEREADGGRVYLSDFGIVRAQNTRGLTQEGLFVGTLDFAAPELIEAKPLDGRVDVYALGCVLYYALTGRLPFERESDLAVIYAHLSEPPPVPSELDPQLPRLFDEVVRRALAKRPEDRYASAGELGAAALAALREHEVVTTERPATPSAEPLEPGESPASASAAPAPPAPSPPLEPPAPAPPAPAVPPPPPPVVLDGSNQVVGLRLDAQFRYVHEPVTSDQEGIPFLGNRGAVDALKERIRHSNGGSFLITGFRGVGKTTVIRRALSELGAEPDEPDLIPLFLNVARPMTTDELLFEVVRRLFEALVDEGVLARLSPDLQRALILAYTRTSLSFKETRANSVERGRSLGFDLSTAVPLLAKLGPKLDLSRKETSSLATEASFLTYSDADVEHDFLRIVTLLTRPPMLAAPSRKRRLLSVLGLPQPPPAPPWQGRIVVVLDELDKLTAGKDGVNSEGVEAFEAILGGLKNLLTTRGVFFLFVAGPEIHDLALTASQRGNSVYESVFGWQLYVPCLWQAAADLADALVSAEDRDSSWLAVVRDHLSFKARGVPRLLLLELNQFVAWQDGRALLRLDSLASTRVQFYASLQHKLTAFMLRAHEAAPLAVPIDEDRWRLGAYYVTDWILRNRNRTFTVSDITGTTSTISVDPTLVLAEPKVNELLDHLVRSGVLEQVRGLADHTLIADAPETEQAAYRVVDSVFTELSRFQRADERERADLQPSSLAAGTGPEQPWADAPARRVVGDGRYELLSEFGRSGVCNLYEAEDRLGRQRVVIKMLESQPQLQNPAVVRRFAREMEFARTLHHPNLVPFHGTLEEPDQRLGIVMAYVPGISLAELLAWGPVPADEAVRIGLELLELLRYLADRGLVRVDFKPTNITIDDNKHPILVDIGLLRRKEERDESQPDAPAPVTTVGILIGTPRYASPEQARGQEIDRRSDLYTLALVLYEMIAGRPARPASDIAAALEQAKREELDLDDLPISPELRAVLRHALAPEADSRFHNPSAMAEALAAVPEATRASTLT
jgi:serine/threonine protein kinase